MKNLNEEIGSRPRKPLTYDLQKKRGTPKDLEAVKAYDTALAEWESKFDKRREEINESFPEPPKEVLKFSKSQLVKDFLEAYKAVNHKYFLPTNPFSDSQEPYILLETLLYYFFTDNKFLDSPILSKVSEPNLRKGLLIVGGYGCGKTSMFRALKYQFENYILEIEKGNYENKNYLISSIDFDSCVSTEVVMNYNNCRETSNCQDVMRGLVNKKPLYIDDILREDVAFNYGKRNIFKEVLSVRADKGYKTFLTYNYLELDENGTTAGTFESLNQFKSQYDGRIYDRLFEMFNVIELSGKSFRR